MALSPLADPAGRASPFSEPAPRPVAWLWPGRLALGNLANPDGHPALGKSTMMLNLCARLSHGRLFPDGSPGEATLCRHGPGRGPLARGGEVGARVANGVHGRSTARCGAMIRARKTGRWIPSA